MGKEREGPCNLVEVDSPFHGITTAQSVSTLFTCPVYDFLNVLGKKRVGHCNLLEVASPSHVLTILLQSPAHILKCHPTVPGQVLYMCYYSKCRVRAGITPARCVLNGLQTVPIPPELAALDLLSRQLIQRAKCYQTVVRLGTYTGKVPRYNSLQACKGTMFFLPLPLNKTIETLNKVQQHTSVLPDPEL